MLLIPNTMVTHAMNSWYDMSYYFRNAVNF